MPGRGERKPRPAPDVRDGAGFNALLETFFDSLRAKNYAETTIENRRRYIGELIAWCADRGISRPREITKPVLERFQR